MSAQVSANSTKPLLGLQQYIFITKCLLQCHPARKEHFSPNLAANHNFLCAQLGLNTLLLPLLGVNHPAAAQLPTASRQWCGHRSQSKKQLYWTAGSFSMVFDFLWLHRVI